MELQYGCHENNKSNGFLASAWMNTKPLRSCQDLVKPAYQGISQPWTATSPLPSENIIGCFSDDDAPSGNACHTRDLQLPSCTRPAGKTRQEEGWQPMTQDHQEVAKVA